jgi:GNAT superfamily N-acetyltransferase
VRIREWHPAIAPDAELVAWLDVYNASLATDLPEDPPWRLDGLREWLVVEMPDADLAYFVAEDAGETVGIARLWLPGHENRHWGDVAISVPPARRRGGIGAALLGAAAGRLARDGRRTLIADVTEGTDGVAFAEALGLRCALREARSLLAIAEVDPSQIAALAAVPHPGYEIRWWRDELPEEMLAP